MKYYIPPVIVSSRCSGPSTFIDFLIAFGISAVIVLLVVAATLYVLNRLNL